MNRMLQTTFFLLLLPATALAHSGAEASGLAAGLLHPLTGADHLIATLAAGIWFASRTRYSWSGTLSLLLPPLAVGLWLGLAGYQWSPTELLLIASVILPGMALLLPLNRLTTTVTTAAITTFTLVHGLAHGSELPVHAAGGVAVTSVVLLTTGHALGRALHRHGSIPLAGSLIALGGVLMLA